MPDELRNRVLSLTDAHAQSDALDQFERRAFEAGLAITPWLNGEGRLYIFNSGDDRVFYSADDAYAEYRRRQVK